MGRESLSPAATGMSSLRFASLRHEIENEYEGAAAVAPAQSGGPTVTDCDVKTTNIGR